MLDGIILGIPIKYFSNLAMHEASTFTVKIEIFIKECWWYLYGGKEYKETEVINVEEDWLES